MQNTPPTNDEIAAALAAIALYLAPTIPPAPATLPSAPAGWQAAIKLDYHTLTAHKARVRPSWHTIERLRRR